MTKTIDALVEALEIINRIASNWSADPRTDAREAEALVEAALTQARAEQAEPVESVCATCGALRADPVLEPSPNNLAATVFVYRSRTSGEIRCAYLDGAFEYDKRPGWEHLATLEPRRWIQQHYESVTAAQKLEPLTDAEIKKMWKEYAPIIGGIFDFTRAVEAAHNAKLTESQKR